MNRNKIEIQSIGICLLLFILLILVIFTHTDYGITWDESLHQEYGDYIYDWFTSFFKKRKATFFFNLYLYGGLFDGSASFLQKLIPYDRYDLRHLYSAIVGVLGIFGIYKVGTVIKNKSLGLLCAIFLTLTPTYYGHMFNNPKDIPFAVAYIWSLYYLILMLKSLPNFNRSLSIKIGLCIGAAIGVRVGGFLLICYSGLFILLHFLPRGKAYFIEHFPHVLKNSLLSVFIAYFTMLIYWPWASVRPLHNALKGLLKMSNFEFYNSPDLFKGKLILAADMPWDYLPHFLLIKLPEIIPILLGIGLISIIFKKNFKNVGVQLLIFSSIFPILFVILNDSILYDACRQFIFVIPPLIALAAFSLNNIFHFLKNYRSLKIAFTLLISLYTIYHLSIFIRLHPFQYVYYNQYVGGLAGTYEKYEHDYWGNGFREAAHKLTTYLQELHGDQFSKKKFKLYFTGNMASTLYYVPKNILLTSNEKGADYSIYYTRTLIHRKRKGKTILKVERLGVPLLFINKI